MTEGEARVSKSQCHSLQGIGWTSWVCPLFSFWKDREKIFLFPRHSQFQTQLLLPLFHHFSCPSLFSHLCMQSSLSLKRDQSWQVLFRLLGKEWCLFVQLQLTWAWVWASVCDRQGMWASIYAFLVLFGSSSCGRSLLRDDKRSLGSSAESVYRTFMCEKWWTHQKFCVKYTLLVSWVSLSILASFMNIIDTRRSWTSFVYEEKINLFVRGFIDENFCHL